jgi:hypothetical protein
VDDVEDATDAIFAIDVDVDVDVDVDDMDCIMDETDDLQGVIRLSVTFDTYPVGIEVGIDAGIEVVANADTDADAIDCLVVDKDKDDDDDDDNGLIGVLYLANNELKTASLFDSVFSTRSIC